MAPAASGGGVGRLCPGRTGAREAVSGRGGREEPGRPTMSYRAFKRLLGETSLERKCRFLFGGFILLLITCSFWLYARQTEGLAYEQMDNMCRLLVPPIVVRQHTAKLGAKNEKNPHADNEESTLM